MKTQGYRRLLGALSLLGATLLSIGMFLPWIIRVDYFPHANCLNGPNCPPPAIDTRSLFEFLVGTMTLASLSWWSSVAVGLGPLLLVIFLQIVIGFSGLRGRGSWGLFALGLISAVIVLTLSLAVARFYYCLFFCGTGLFTVPGYRIFASGFWLLLAGFIIAIACDLLFLLLSRRHTDSA